MKKLLERIYNLLPLYSWNAVERANGAGYCDGFLAGSKDSGITRGHDGRFRSLKPKRKLGPALDDTMEQANRRFVLGTIHASDEDLSSLARVESPDRRSSSLPD